MKTFAFLVVLLGALLLQVKAHSQIQPSDGLDISIEKISGGTISVGIHNDTDKTIRVWSNVNSWGAAHWRVLVLKDGGMKTFFQNPSQLFTKNSPTFYELGKDETHHEILDVNDGNWCGLHGEKISFEAGDTMIVLYDVPPTKEGYKLEVWYGVVAAYNKMQ